MGYSKINIGLALIISLLSLTSTAQNYGNEWINFDQTYYRIPIAKDGLYRINISQLENYGVPVGNFNPQNIQLFYNGAEIPCYIKGADEGLMEYIEFFAEKNTGWFDQEMYTKPTDQLNPYYSLINDTASVFLTWNNKFNNKRFTVTNLTDASALTPVAYCTIDTLLQFAGQYFVGEIDCEYVAGEGWSDKTEVSLGQSVTKKIITSNVYNSAPASVEMGLLTFSSGMHHINITGMGIQFDTIFAGIGNIKHAKSIPASTLSENNALVFKSIDDQEATTDFSSVSFIRLSYPSLLNFEGYSARVFELAPSPDRNIYLSISGLDVSGELILYDMTRNLKVTCSNDNGMFKAIIPSSSQIIKMVLATTRGINQPDYLSYSALTNFASKNKQRIIISNKKIWSQAQVYAQYRNALLVDVDELYSQFGYGIVKHPLAIRNFINYVYHTWNVKPKSLFIIGKGIAAVDTRNNPQNYANCLVPPMGEPATDVLFSVRIAETGNVSALSTGRISAASGNDVSLYYNKVLEFESNAQAEWMKNIIHFGGGNTANEQNTFKNYLSNYENTIEDTLIGAHVSTFLKASSDPIATSKTDSVEKLINQGVSLITFFGHGYSGGFDQNIDDPATYKNQGKYPLLLANSCYSGNIFQTNKSSSSEDWVLIANRGTIGFLAMVYQGNANYLNLFSDQFYQQWAYKNYGASLGEMVNQTRFEIQNIMSNSYIKNTIQQFNLHGDPEIVLNTPMKPDLEITASDIYFTPSKLTTEKDSFEINIILRNIGKTINSDFQIDIKRSFSDGSSAPISKTFSKLYYKDTLAFKLPTELIKGIGVNLFQITLDPLNQLDELNENNNTITISNFITSTNLSAIVPFNYSIIPTIPDALHASTADALAQSQTSTFQIDTIASFNSPFLYSQEITHSGGVVDWSPAVSIPEGKACFWRVAEKKNAKNASTWSQSSFIYRSGISGWEQNHFDQLKANSFQLILSDTLKKQFKFTDAPKTLRCHNLGSPSSQYDYNSIGYTVDGIGDVNTCGAVQALLVAVVDSATMQPWPDSHGDYGQINSSTGGCRDSYYFIFYMDVNNRANQMNALVNMVDNIVPDGFYILIYSFFAGNFQLWPESGTLAFERWGAEQVRFIDNDVPYIFFTRKGYPDQTIEVVGASNTDEIDLNINLKSNFTYGSIFSSVIGPAKNWQGLEWQSHALEENPKEIAYMNLFGYNRLGDRVLLADSIQNNTYDLSTLDAKQYPKLQLQFFTRDEVFKTPSQLTQWQVKYNPFTDLAMNPSKGWEFAADTLQEGQRGKLSLTIENIANVTSDSVVMKYWLQNNANQTTALATRKFGVLNQGQTLTDTLSFSTIGHSGINYFWAEVNPVNPAENNYYQPEQTHFNNLLNKSFYVSRDVLNPLLDITFDGLHIMDGDLISARPEIAISLTDENPYLAMNDTSLITLYIKSYVTGIEQKIPISNNPKLIYTPGNTGKNKASIAYYPVFDTDGTYQLRVRANDATGNESGANDYIITFQVVNESTITHLFNYPNPFSTSTRFVFELTGFEIPDEMRIDIMTLSGKIVKVIYLDELGPIRIGKNITTYSWDGRDTYGDPLANGVYFYKVSARINGQSIKSRSTDADQYFNHGIGKMYILR